MPKILSIMGLALAPFSMSFAAPSTAAKITAPVELRELAVKEASSEGVSRKNASDAQIADSGLLRLEDPGLADRSSPWRWIAGLHLRSINPGGTAEMRNGQTFDLGSVGSTLLPVVGFGLQRNFKKTETASWSTSIVAEAGYVSQDTKVRYVSGVAPSDSRLATGTLGATVGVSARFARLSSVEWRGGWTEGLMTSSHSAPDNAVNFTEQGRFGGPRVGVSYWPNALVALDLDAESMSNTLQTESGSISFGTRVTW